MPPHLLKLLISPCHRKHPSLRSLFAKNREIDQKFSPAAGNVVSSLAGAVVSPSAGNVVSSPAGAGVSPLAGNVVSPSTGKVVPWFSAVSGVVCASAGNVVSPPEKISTHLPYLATLSPFPLLVLFVERNYCLTFTSKNNSPKTIFFIKNHFFFCF